MPVPMLSGARRRYLIAKYTINPAISAEKKTATTIRNRYSASTRPAIVEARSGKSGIPVHISARAPCGGHGGARCAVLRARCLVHDAWCTVPGAAFAPEHDRDEAAKRENRGRAGEAHGAHDDESVAAGHRVVGIAIENQRVDCRPDPAGRGCDDCKPQIARSVLDAEQIPGQTAVGRENDDAGRMGELLRVRVQRLPKTGRLRQTIDRALVAGEK